MSDLRERLQELADVAALHSRSPGPRYCGAAPASGGCG